MPPAYRLRILRTAMATCLAVVGLTGCGLIHSAQHHKSAPSAAPSTEDPNTYNPDASGEVVGTDCQYHNSARKFSYKVSIQNASTDHAFTYNFSVTFSGGDSEFADDTFGAQDKTVTVAPSKDRTLTVTYQYDLPRDRGSYYDCTISRAEKSLAD